ncbi:MAG: tetratricopeptide repeat protein [Armatimonadia bacterium]|nr:tetratricopeptide repeat protein [Armatimonadia bacterium]
MRGYAGWAALALTVVVLLSGCARWELERMAGLQAKARQQALDGRLDEALITAETMVKTSPENRYSWWTLAIVHQSRWEFEKADRAIQRAIELAPESTLPELYYASASIYHDAGEYDKAVEQYRKTLELAPDFPGILPHLANALTSAGRFDEAQEMVDRALAESPADARTHWALGVLHAERDDYEKAECALREAVELNPESLKARRSLGWVLDAEERHEEAVEQFEKALEIVPGDAWTHLNLGYALHDMNRLDEAVAHLSEAFEYYQTDPEAFGVLAWDLIRVGRSEEALRLVRRYGGGLSEGDQPQVTLFRALALVYEGHEAAARRANAELDPDDLAEPWMQVQHALVWMYVGDLERAEQSCRDASDRDPSAALPHVGLALTGALNGDSDMIREQVSILDEDFDGRNRSSDAAYSLAVARDGDTAEAREELERLDEKPPGDYPRMHYLYLAGLAYRELGEIERSDVLFQRAIDRWPKHPWSAKMRRMMERSSGRASQESAVMR